MESNASSTAGSAGWSQERRRLDRALASGMRVVRDVLLRLAVQDRLSMIRKCRLILDALESHAIAEELASGTSTRKVEDLVQAAASGQASKRTVKKKARRGVVINENPVLGKKMASGDLSDEQLDVIADASEKTGGDAAHDTELISKIAAAPPEQGKKLADAYVRDRQSQDDVDTAYERARRARRVRRYTDEERGTDVLQFEGAAEDIDAIETHIDQLAEQFYRDDGGRDVDSDAHRRTRDQRRFDAAAALTGRSDTVARDGGCVRCEVGHSRCVVHHLDPWTSRLKGESNVDRMALMCDDCHHHIHDNDLTLLFDSGGVWRTRRARPEEVAAARPPRADSRPPRQQKVTPTPDSRSARTSTREASLFTQRE